MSELFSWFMDIKNSKIAALLIFFTTFVGILLYVYGSKRRSERLESYRNIPFLDDDLDDVSVKSSNDNSNSNEKLKDNDQSNTEHR